jgi:hypothetical protein
VQRAAPVSQEPRGSILQRLGGRATAAELAAGEHGDGDGGETYDGDDAYGEEEEEEDYDQGAEAYDEEGAEDDYDEEDVGEEADGAYDEAGDAEDDEEEEEGEEEEEEDYEQGEGEDDEEGYEEAYDEEDATGYADEDNEDGEAEAEQPQVTFKAPPSLLAAFRQKKETGGPAAAVSHQASAPRREPPAPAVRPGSKPPATSQASFSGPPRRTAAARPVSLGSAEDRVRTRKRRIIRTTGTSTDYEEAQKALERALHQEGPSRDERGYAVGTCPDMCPALERYRRMQTGVSDSDGHLWHFEMTGSRPDHGKMIKEYRKEAADSNVEGASLLRPPHVLVMTMSYIMRRILPMLDTGELQNANSRLTWFDFISDRLRAVRKDIKTQNLATLEAVGILEQCIRFHIAAAYRLSSCKRFDRKLNDDRIKDSFGMLEGCYSDLRSSIEGEIGNEAEMRSYQLLRSLGCPSVLVKARGDKMRGLALCPSPLMASDMSLLTFSHPPSRLKSSDRIR